MIDLYPDFFEILSKAAKNECKNDNDKYFEELFTNGAVNSEEMSFHNRVTVCYFWTHYVTTHIEEVYNILIVLIDGATVNELMRVKNYLKNYVYYEQYGFDNIKEILSPLMDKGEWNKFVSRKDEIDRLRRLEYGSSIPEAEFYRKRNRRYREKIS